MAERANTLALVHETTHQLTFNTGVLERGSDVPRCISEGLATYAETRRPDASKGRIGDVNEDRLKVLVDASQSGQEWPPLVQLLCEDKLFEDGQTEQLAYAKSWLFTHAFLNSAQGRLRAFRDYLDVLRRRTDANNRFGDATDILGDLDKIDADLTRYAKQLPAPRRRISLRRG
jgi:hypothetical protein